MVLNEQQKARIVEIVMIYEDELSCCGDCDIAWAADLWNELATFFRACKR